VASGDARAVVDTVAMRRHADAGATAARVAAAGVPFRRALLARFRRSVARIV